MLNCPYSLLVSCYTLENHLFSLGFIPQLLISKVSLGDLKILCLCVSQTSSHGINSGLFIFIYLSTLTQSPATSKILSLKMDRSTMAQQQMAPYYVSDSYHFTCTARRILKSCIEISSRQCICEKRCLSNDESNDLAEPKLSVFLTHVS